MAYVFKLPPTVTEEIMRNVVGYPRDRIRDMMSTVARAILDGRFGRPLAEWGPYHVTWRYKRYSNDDDRDYHVTDFNPESMDMTIDDDREGSLRWSTMVSRIREHFLDTAVGVDEECAEWHRV